ncbi:MAG: MoaD/ThiS family protein [Chloroflexi bacterium]|nr:MoaD/ThiS family protein [Chloroflexota bacterium]
MPQVWLFASLRNVTRGKCPVTVPGATVRQVVESLDTEYPGAREALTLDGDLMPGLAVVVDGETSALGLLQPVQEASEVHFLPAIGGGSPSA